VLMARSRIRSLVLTLVTVLVPSAVLAQTEVWTIDPGHSAATPQVRHMVVANVKGEFAGPVGSATFDPTDLSTLRIDATIDARTINTRNPDRDKDLRSDLFFDVAKYPRITFKSRSVAVEGPGRLKVAGDLTIHGVTKPVTLDVEVLGTDSDPWGGTRAGFEGTASISRKEWGVDFNIPMDGGRLLIGDKIDIVVSAQAVLQQDEAPAQQA